jgi:hypothetical protein
MICFVELTVNDNNTAPISQITGTYVRSIVRRKSSGQAEKAAKLRYSPSHATLINLHIILIFY